MKRLIFIGLLLVVYLFSFAQSKEDLERKKMQNYKDIQFTNELLEKTTVQKKTSYNRLLLLNRRIKSRQNIITTINDEIDYLEEKVFIHQDVVLNLKADLNKLKDEYAKMVYYSFLHKGSYNKVMFILASDDFNMGYRRLKYYQQYSQHRKKQAELIIKTEHSISEEIVVLEIIKAEKRDLLLDQQQENITLVTEKNDQNSSLRKIKSEEEKLRKKLRAQYKVAANLQKEITRIIEEEARLAAERSNKSSNRYFQLTPEEQLIADNIFKNKNRLPWPTSRGIITSDFGEHPHPFIGGIVVRNDGVDISTNKGATVRSIFDGVVSRVFVVAGAHKTVIIRHGNYLTVYSNLKDVIIKQGDIIKTKQTIGTIFTEHDNGEKTILQFQIWKENEKLNPEDWLAKQKNG